MRWEHLTYPELRDALDKSSAKMRKQQEAERVLWRRYNQLGNICRKHIPASLDTIGVGILPDGTVVLNIPRRSDESEIRFVTPVKLDNEGGLLESQENPVETP